MNKKIITTIVIMISLLLVDTKILNKKQIININKKEYREGNSINFPDSKFAECIVNRYNFLHAQDQDFVPENDANTLTQNQLETITDVQCPNMGINDVTGIEKLTNLCILHLENSNNTSTPNQIKKIDLSNFSKLKDLFINNNKLTELKVNKINNPMVSHVVVNNNQLSEIDLSSYDSISEININNNPFQINQTIQENEIVDIKIPIKLPKNKGEQNYVYTNDDDTIAKIDLENKTIKGIKAGSVDIHASYKKSEYAEYNYTIHLKVESPKPEEKEETVVVEDTISKKSLLIGILAITLLLIGIIIIVTIIIKKSKDNKKF